MYTDINWVIDEHSCLTLTHNLAMHRPLFPALVVEISVPKAIAREYGQVS